MHQTGKLRRVELYDGHKAPYTDVRKVWDANRDRYPGWKLVVTNAHWYDPGPTACGNYKVAGEVISLQWPGGLLGFGWNTGALPVMTRQDARYGNFLSTIPALYCGERQDVSGQTSGVQRACARTWFGRHADGRWSVEVTSGNYTLDGILLRMQGLGVVDGLVLDGSGSSQCYDGETRLYGDGRTIYSYLLTWWETDHKEDETMKIYLSPSSQAANTYAAGGTNEQAQCNRIAAAAKTALERCGFAVRKAPEGQDYRANVAESNAWGADLHIPIHTNAGNGQGTAVFTYDLATKRLKYAKPIYEAVQAVTPGTVDYGVRADKGLYEVAQTTAPCVYLECEFHDRADLAAWIVANVDKLGEAIAKGVCQGAGLAYVGPATAPEEETGPSCPHCGGKLRIEKA